MRHCFVRNWSLITREDAYPPCWAEGVVFVMTWDFPNFESKSTCMKETQWCETHCEKQDQLFTPPIEGSWWRGSHPVVSRLQEFSSNRGFLFASFKHCSLLCFNSFFRQSLIFFLVPLSPVIFHLLQTIFTQISIFHHLFQVLVSRTVCLFWQLNRRRSQSISCRKTRASRWAIICENVWFDPQTTENKSLWICLLL